MLKAKSIKKLSLFTLAVVGICVLGASGATCDALPADVSVGGELIAGGMPFGMKVNIDGAIVVETSDVEGAGKSPAAQAGIKRGDIIVAVNGKEVSSSKELIGAIEESEGEIDVSYQRAGRERTAKVVPALDANGKKRIGVLTRDSAAGIGTVTYIDPETLSFAGLGHGICDSESGAVLPIDYGSVEDVEITGINRGRSGSPGEMRGAFTGRRIGKITSNKETGVYGVLSELPEHSGDVYKVASADEVKDGQAYIRSCVGGSPELYEIEITRIGTGAQKNFAIKVTDARLTEMTGGIVQGMSGSPVIQNGKLIGAVTHVLVGDPTCGYGIFIENMTENSASGEIYEDSAA